MASASSRAKSAAQDVRSGKEDWSQRSNLSIFVRCLHLLDLDLRQDWPGITEKTFSTRDLQQNLQQRVRSVEWSLFRLFEIYSPTETQNKLKPFFPPHTSLQSTNLRAALLRLLTELKKNGVLGRSVVLRKTMLDDCKGDRLEELLSNFAMVVLRSAISRKEPAVNKRLSLVSDLPEEHQLPLLLAHRMALKNFLAAREGSRRSAMDAIESSREDLRSLNERRTKASEPVKGFSSSEWDSALDCLRSSFCGDGSWLDVIISGGLILQPTEISHPKQSPLTKLSERLEDHKKNLAKLQDFAYTLPSRPHQEPPTTQHDRPHILQSRSDSSVKNMSESGAHVEASAEKAEILSSYKDLVVRMERELLQRGPHDERLSQHKSGHSALPSTVVTMPEQHSQEQSLFPSLSNDFSAGTPLLSAGEEKSKAPHSVGTISDPTPQPPATIASIEVQNGNVTLPPDVEGPEKGRDPDLTSQVDVAAEESQESPEESALTHKSGLTLMERTRMSLAASMLQPPARSRTSQRRSSQFPVSQFETPQKQDKHGTPLSPASNDSTPREKLFSDDAEYASVFKTRTKIHLSPMISPDRSMLDDSLLRSRLENLDLEEE